MSGQFMSQENFNFEKMCIEMFLLLTLYCHKIIFMVFYQKTLFDFFICHFIVNSMMPLWILGKATHSVSGRLSKSGDIEIKPWDWDHRVWKRTWRKVDGKMSTNNWNWTRVSLGNWNLNSINNLMTILYIYRTWLQKSWGLG